LIISDKNSFYLELVNYINKVIFDKFIQIPLYYHDNGNHAVVISPRNLHLRHHYIITYWCEYNVILYLKKYVHIVIWINMFLVAFYFVYFFIWQCTKLHKLNFWKFMNKILCGRISRNIPLFYPSLFYVECFLMFFRFWNIF